VAQIKKATDKFTRSWLDQPDKATWYYRFADSLGLSLFSLPTDNGLEGTNNMLKKEYTQRELSGLSRTILLAEQFIQDRSKDPERKVSPS
jgi:hypothetical protein